MSVMIQGSWKDIKEEFVAVNGEWRKVKDKFVAVNGEWRKAVNKKKPLITVDDIKRFEIIYILNIYKTFDEWPYVQYNPALTTYMVSTWQQQAIEFQWKHDASGVTVYTGQLHCILNDNTDINLSTPDQDSNYKRLANIKIVLAVQSKFIVSGPFVHGINTMFSTNNDIPDVDFYNPTNGQIGRNNNRDVIITPERLRSSNYTPIAEVGIIRLPETEIVPTASNGIFRQRVSSSYVEDLTTGKRSVKKTYLIKT